MNDQEVLQNESETGYSVSETETTYEESSSVDEVETSSDVVETTTIAYEDTIQYDLNYNFGYMSLWFGVVFGALLVIAFFKGFKS